MHGDMGAADDRNEGNVLPLLVCIKIAQSRGSSDLLAGYSNPTSTAPTRFLVRNLDTGALAFLASFPYLACAELV